MKRDLESVAILVVPHLLQTARETLRIAELAARADLIAAGNRIPGVFGPLYVGLSRRR